jgi:hypothetical protein
MNNAIAIKKASDKVVAIPAGRNRLRKPKKEDSTSRQAIDERARYSNPDTQRKQNVT